MDLWMDVDAALSEVPVNLMPLVDDTDFKTIEAAVAYNAAGMDLRWNFVTTGGSFTSTAVTPTTGGTYDWTHQGDGIYTIEIPASAGASINNDTEGFGWFSGVVTGVLPFRGPVIGFRAAALNDALIDGGDNLDVNVTQFGGTNATSSGGRPEVNTTHAAGTAWGSGAITAASIAADAITDAKVASDVTIASVTGAVGSVTGNVGGNVTGSVGSVASGGITAASFGANAITAAKLDPDVTSELQAGLATAASLTTVEGKIDILDTNVDTLLTRITSTLFAGITSLAEWLGLMAGKQTGNTTARTEMRATGAGSGTYSETTDSLEAVRDRGDAAWTTATGFSTLDAAGVRTAVGLASANLDTQLAAIDDAVDLEVAAIKAVTDKLDDTLEDDGGTYRFTVNALEQAPAGGGGGSTDWTADERTAIRAILGVPGSGTTPADPSTGILDTIRDSVATRASQTSVDDLPTNAELATALAAADDAILAAIAALNNLSQANIRTAIGLATANLDTQLDALPTAAELATALASADDAVLAAIAALNNLSSAQAQTAAAAALTAYDPPTKAELDTAVDALPTASENAAAVLAAATANPIDANVQEINDVTLVGDGSTTPWGPV
jgi:hypothetical protein